VLHAYFREWGKMNEDIAYSVLSFLENPMSYARVSRAFQAGAAYA
jgi:hypothetical protein